MILALESFTQDDWIQTLRKVMPMAMQLSVRLSKWVPERRVLLRKKCRRTNSARNCRWTSSASDSIHQKVSLLIPLHQSEKGTVLDRNSQLALATLSQLGESYP